MARARNALALAVLVLVLLVPGVALAALSVTRAELNGDRLRLEGVGAVANATITVDGAALGRAGADGSFRVERQPYASATCRAAVSDGATSVTVTLSGCTPAGTGPTPAAGFQGLGQLAGGPGSFALGVSADGEVVVGFALDARGRSPRLPVDGDGGDGGPRHAGR